MFPFPIPSNPVIPAHLKTFGPIDGTQRPEHTQHTENLHYGDGTIPGGDTRVLAWESRHFVEEQGGHGVTEQCLWWPERSLEFGSTPEWSYIQHTTFWESLGLWSALWVSPERLASWRHHHLAFAYKQELCWVSLVYRKGFHQAINQSTKCAGWKICKLRCWWKWYWNLVKCLA